MIPTEAKTQFPHRLHSHAPTAAGTGCQLLSGPWEAEKLSGLIALFQVFQKRLRLQFCAHGQHSHGILANDARHPYPAQSTGSVLRPDEDPFGNV